MIEPSNVIPRVASEQAAASLASRGVRVSVVRLPPSVHGDGDHGFVPMLIGFAREKGVSAYVGEGLNRWASVIGSMPRSSTASCLRRTLPEPAITPSPDEGVPFKDIAGVIGRRLDVPVVSKSAEEATRALRLVRALCSAQRASLERAHASIVGLAATGPSLIPDLDRPGYFET